MGVKDIIVLFEDAFSSKFQRPYYENETICSKVGKGVLKVSDLVWRGKNKKKYTEIFDLLNAVYFVDKIERPNQKLYFWKNNSLRQIHKLSDEDLKQAEKILRAEKKRRGLK